MELFLKTSNTIYGSLQAAFGHKENYIHRGIVARELTDALAQRFPELIRVLSVGLNEHTTLLI